jgi:hypothetical protein
MRDSLWHLPIIWIGLAHSEIEIMRDAGESSSDLSWFLFPFKDYVTAAGGDAIKPSLYLDLIASSAES